MSSLTFNIIRHSTQRTAARRGTLSMTQTVAVANSTDGSAASAAPSSTNGSGNEQEVGQVADNLIKRVIETPGCFMHTVRGTVPHFTPDTMRHQGFGGTHVSIEQLLQEHQPAGLEKWPFTLSKFLNLQDFVLLCDLRDPSHYRKVPPNTDRYISIKTNKGVHQLTLEEYLKVIRVYQPDIVAAMADHISDLDISPTTSAVGAEKIAAGSDSGSRTQESAPLLEPGLKRVRRSVDRSLKWLDQVLLDRQGGDAMAEDRALEEAKQQLRKMKQLGLSHDIPKHDNQPKETQQKSGTGQVRKPWTNLNVFAHVLGSHVEQERIRSAQETARREGVSGFIIDTNPLQGSSKETIMNLLKTSIDHLPAEKPRMVYGLQTPEDVLSSIALGVDLFDTSYPFYLTEDGKASLYSFGSNSNEINHESVASTNNNMVSSAMTNRWINLWDDEHADKFVPILEGCGCIACKGGRHTRAYINHLLKAHEMLATVLLMSHNMYQYSKFFANVRQSIQDGTFEEHSATFVKQFGTEPARTREIHAAQAIVEASLSKRSRLNGHGSNESASCSEDQLNTQTKEELVDARKTAKEQEKRERREKNRLEGLKRQKEKQSKDEHEP
ncbi:Queuine tRNA-ribosyltransferase subunit qtrtd1 [Linnemannia zychae]|nr:Queuine tRNA-ribosyltransferase subunit qtrtd1 [Linnemannia zychae]